MRILDLCCSAGGAAMGYHLAFPDAEIIGVDIEPQPNYPFEFDQCDAMTAIADSFFSDNHLPRANPFDLVHASPPCQLFTAYRRRGGGVGDGYPNLIPAIRDALKAAGVPYVIENVPGSPLINPTQLCGSSFGWTSAGTDCSKHRSRCSPHPATTEHRHPDSRRQRTGRTCARQWRSACGVSRSQCSNRRWASTG